MGSLHSGLKSKVNTRRTESYGIKRTSSENFESLECLDPNDETSSSKTRKRADTSVYSPFYIACRSNNIEEVRRLIQTMSPADIDRLEPNGSTALHAASYYGHPTVVKILLEKGADRSIKNRFNCLPFDESLNDAVRDMFHRIPTANRFINNTGTIEWEMFDKDAVEKAKEEQDIIQTLYEKTSSKKMFDNILQNYVAKGLKYIVNFEQIQRFFEQAAQEEDPQGIIKAYTAESDFYKILNVEIAGGAAQYQSERRYIIALLRFHPKLEKYVHLGQSHRAVQLTSDQLSHYQIGSTLMTKAFVSSSIDEKVVELFIAQKEENQKAAEPSRFGADGRDLKKIWVIFIYHIKKHRTALHIEDISQYPTEGEVLIMPYSVFQVKTNNPCEAPYLTKNQTVRKIFLEEIEESSK